MSTLRQLIATDPSKPYYLTAAPQCPRPDRSILVPELLSDIDFFSVQFYNNPSCQLNAGQDFLDSLQAWSSDLAAGASSSKSTSKRRSSFTSRIRPRLHKTRRQPGTGASFNVINNGITAPRLLIGTPAFAAAGSGFVSVSDYKIILEQVKAMALPNLAGAMFWDGAYLERSGQPVPGVGNSVNVTYAEVVRDVLSPS